MSSIACNYCCSEAAKPLFRPELPRSGRLAGASAAAVGETIGLGNWSKLCSVNSVIQGTLRKERVMKVKRLQNFNEFVQVHRAIFAGLIILSALF
jgi:hypothetical protein